MLNFRSNYPSESLLVFTFLLLFPLISATFVTQYSPGDFRLQNTQIPDERQLRGGGVDYTKRRIIAAEENNDNSSNVNNNSTGEVLILAAERTHRKDPSDNFKYYTGGWNITNSHYLYSVGFSSAPPFIAAVVWFLLFGLYLIFIFIRHCCCSCCRSREAIGCSRTAFVMSLGFLILFTVATVAACVVTYVGQQKFQTNIVRVTSFVLHQADNAFSNLRNLLNNLLAAKSIGVEQVTLPPEILAQIDQIGVTVNTLADNFHSVSANSTQEIRSFLKPMRLSLTYAAVALLILAIVGFVISILGWKCLVYCLVIICWILVTTTLIISGMFLLVHNAVEDTCVAVDEWLQNPTADSALENIIPKVDNQTAQQIFSVSKGVAYGVVQVIDGAIANISNANNIPPNAGPIYYNQSGPLMPILCNPYYSNLTQRQCAPGEVDFHNASEVWSSYVCQVSESGICDTPGRVTPTGYANIITSTNVSYALYEQSPFLVDLIDSTYIKQTFDRISRIYCPGLSRYSQWTYVGFVTASVGVILSLMLWICNIKGGSTRACAGHF